MTPYDSMIEPIANRNFGNTFQHYFGPNQLRHTHKIPVNSTNTETLDNSTYTETLVNNINTEILVNNINTYPFKDPGHHQSHT